MTRRLILALALLAFIIIGAWLDAPVPENAL